MYLNISKILTKFLLEDALNNSLLFSSAICFLLLIEEIGSRAGLK